MDALVDVPRDSEDVQFFAIGWKFTRADNFQLPRDIVIEQRNRLEQIFNSLLRTQETHEENSRHKTLACVGPRKKLTLIDGAGNNLDGSGRCISPGQFVSVADQRSAREPAAQAREEPVLERVEKRKGIQRGPASDAGFQERLWIADDPMANRSAKQR